MQEGTDQGIGKSTVFRHCDGGRPRSSHIRAILVNGQEYQVDLATALGENVPDVTKPEERA